MNTNLTYNFKKMKSNSINPLNTNTMNILTNCFDYETEILNTLKNQKERKNL